jgi:hypothetical protein
VGLRRHVPALDPLREVDLLVSGQQRHLADLTQVEAQRVERRLDGEIELRALLLLGQRRLLVRRVLVLLPFDQLDRVVDEVRVEVLDLLFAEVDFLEPGDDLVVGEESLLCSVLYELVEFLDVREGDVDLSFALGGRGTQERKEPVPASPGSPLGAREPNRYPQEWEEFFQQLVTLPTTSRRLL